MQEFKTRAKTGTAASRGGRSAFHNGQSLASLKIPAATSAFG